MLEHEYFTAKTAGLLNVTSVVPLDLARLRK
jgi:hypothetical protein